MDLESISYDNNGKIICQGNWDLTHYSKLKIKLKKIKLGKIDEITIDGQGIHKMDSSGALLLYEWMENLEKQGIRIHLVNFSKRFQALFDIVKSQEKKDTSIPKSKQFGNIAKIGMFAIIRTKELQKYLALMGFLTFEFIRIFFQPSRWRLKSLAGVIYRSGYQALPIISLLSFLIGVVLAYQMGLQLQNYGANLFIVELIGISMLREFGPLITAIMVAGRTGSAFTAQLGMMKLNQEIDALNTLGVTPAELLIIPRVVGLLIALPLLTIVSDIFGVLGGMVMSNSILNISWYDFLLRFQRVISVKTLIIGLGKAPVFALLISTISCFEGMGVKNSAESVGLNTTKSVVFSIFFIIVADAIFSVIFSKLRL